MKYMKNIISILLSAVMILSLSVVSAFAEGQPQPVTPGSSLIFSVTADEKEDLAPVEAVTIEPEYGDDGIIIAPDISNSAPNLPPYSISLIDHRYDDYTRQPINDSVLMETLLIPEAELVITPPEGYYISQLNLNGTSPLSLLTKAYASTQSSELSLRFSELLTADKAGLDGDYVGAYTDGSYVLGIHFALCRQDTPFIRYDSGILGYTGQLTYDPNEFQSSGFLASPLQDAVSLLATSNGLTFDGYLMQYAYGPTLKIQAGEYCYPYDDLTLIAQWRETEVQPTPEPAPEQPEPEPIITPEPVVITTPEPTVTPTPEPVVTPTQEPTITPTPEPILPTTPEPVITPTPLVLPNITIYPDNVSKVYDGTALSATSCSVDGNLNGYSIANVSVDGSLTIPGSIQSNIVYLEMADPYGQPVPPQDIISAINDGTIQILPGTVTITKRPLTVTAISGALTTTGEVKTASELSTADNSYQNGYRADGLLPDNELVGNFVIGSSAESFDTTIDLSRLRVKIRNTDWDVTDYYDITTVPGHITITDLSPTPTPTPPASVYELSLTPKSYTWTYDGMEHRLNEYTSTALADGDRISRVNFKNTSVITNVGQQANEIVSVEIVSSTGAAVPQGKYTVRYTPGLLSVVKRDLTVTAISGNITANGEEKVASNLSNPNDGFTNGYRAEGLANGHRLYGNFVIGSGKTSFQTYIDINNLRVLDAYGNDVTSNYNIRTISGVVNITAPQQTSIPLTVTAKSGTWVYDGNPHSLNEYEVTGLINGDQIERASFKSTSVITNVGTQANEIQSVVIKSSTGEVIDNSKYNIRFIPGTLTVTKFSLTLTAVSDSKAYDGKALNNKNVKSTALANASHKLSADYEVYDIRGNTIKNGPVDVGVYTKQVSNIKILAGNQDVTSNYEITTIDGTLTITGTASSNRTNTSDANAAYYGNTFTIRSEAPYSEFQYLLIDGQRVPSENYSVKEGSTIITLKASYIQSLKAGTHSYSIVSSSRTADGTFTVGKAPRTGDDANILLWVIILILAALAIAATVFFLHRSKKKTGGKTTGYIAHLSSASEKYGESETQNGMQDQSAYSDLEERDPTQNLVSDFEIDLDEFRDTKE